MSETDQVMRNDDADPKGPVQHEYDSEKWGHGGAADLPADLSAPPRTCLERRRGTAV